jgi:NSS family neurotransmitter:Na+ symporter
MQSSPKPEAWSSRLGVILAVAGSAVGLGNFLRFPGQAVQYGSGAFMIAYFIMLVLIGIPICWAEWTMGRYAGQYGFRSSPGIFAVLIKHPIGKYLGAIGVIIPVCIYMYYVYIEAWCLGYAWFFLTGKMSTIAENPTVADYADFWGTFIGAGEDGSALHFGGGVLTFLLIVFILNFVIIFRGISKGIEFFCKYAMPALILMAVVVLVRVLTLGTPDLARPDQSVVNGLGYMWNPGNIWSQLAVPQLWLAAAGQIFFSLSVGFGVIITYASYLSNKDDVVLSGLTASSANEFCEVALGGMIVLPAAFVFIGAASLGEYTNSGFSLGFKVLPMVFASMPFPALFGTIFFGLLFLAAVTSSLSMLQPGIAFLEEALGVGRRASVALLSTLTAIGCMFVVFFSKDNKALNTIDFWVGTFLIFVLATILIIVFGWVMGTEKGFDEAHKGAHMKIPKVFKFIIKWVSPSILLLVFVMWVMENVFGWNPATGGFQPTGYVMDLVGSETQKPSTVARMSVGLIIIISAFMLILVNVGAKRWHKKIAHVKINKGDK